MTHPTAQPTATTVVLAAVQLPGTSDHEQQASLDELERLCTTLGFKTVARVSQKRTRAVTGTILGEGKLKELASWTGGSGEVHRFRRPGSKALDVGDDGDEMGADLEEALQAEPSDEPSGSTDAPQSPRELATLVVMDLELTPTQLKNLEDATGVDVWDRTSLILEIFSRHAKSREARLQVELARLAYLGPRLRLAKLGGDRQGGGIGAKGTGETAHELDRRRIRDRMAELRDQLEVIQTEQSTRRSQRQEAPLVALVGYTNAGKSSLMRALTGSQVLVENKLFATLDTTVRAMHPETVPRILVSDTVGFIKKLPHDLVASFRSTLDEALNARLLLFTVDASDANFRSQLAVTRQVLGEIGADERESLLVLNKSDLLNDALRRELLAEFPGAVLISTKNPNDVQQLRDWIIGFFERGMREQRYEIPYQKGRILGMLRERARVMSEEHVETGTLVTIRAQEDTHSWLRKQLADGAPLE